MDVTGLDSFAANGEGTWGFLLTGIPFSGTKLPKYVIASFLIFISCSVLLSIWDIGVCCFESCRCLLLGASLCLDFKVIIGSFGWGLAVISFALIASFLAFITASCFALISACSLALLSFSFLALKRLNANWIFIAAIATSWVSFIFLLVWNPRYADCILTVASFTSVDSKSGRSSSWALFNFLNLYLLKALWILRTANTTSAADLFFMTCLVLKPLYADWILTVASWTSLHSRSGRESFLASFLALYFLNADWMVITAAITVPISFICFLVLNPFQPACIFMAASTTSPSFRSGRSSSCCFFFIVCLILKPLYTDWIFTAASAKSLSFKSGKSSFFLDFLMSMRFLILNPL